jgi:hypothetical protein
MSDAAAKAAATTSDMFCGDRLRGRRIHPSPFFPRAEPGATLSGAPSRAFAPASVSEKYRPPTSPPTMIYWNLEAHAAHLVFK